MKISSEELLVKIRNQITAYQLNVRSDNKARRYNINDRAESFTIPLFKLIFDWGNLVDLNKNNPNFPGIDLGDYDNRIAIQVTADTTLDKVKDTLSQFAEKMYYRDFDRLFVFMIQERLDSYNQKIINNICGDKLKFNQSSDIVDLSGLMQFIKVLPHQKLEKVLLLFQDETGYIENAPIVQNSKAEENLFSAPITPPFEEGLLNLFEVGFPETLYIADWNFSKKQLGTRIRNDRKLVQEALSQRNLKFAVDWVTMEKQVIAFHDLRDDLLPLTKIIDEGTVTELETREFYKDPIYRNKFVELLQRCLQQKLFHLGIHWQNEEREYIFVPFDKADLIREVEWKDIKADKRMVYRQIPDLKDDTKTYCHEHFAFMRRFYEFDQSWYLAVTPDWFYSSDGYARAWYAIEEKRKYKKLVEANQNISTHVRFIHSYISTNNPQSSHQMSMFEDSDIPIRSYDFLWIKNLQYIDHLPRLPDSDWRPLSDAESNDSDTMF